MAEEATATKTSKPKITQPIFTRAAGGLEVYVQLPEEHRGKKWIKDLNGTYFQRKNAYVFDLNDIAAIEENLGLEAGASGILDPSSHYTVQLTGTVKGADFKALVASLEAAGVSWNKAQKRFEGPTSAQAAIAAHLV